MKKKSIGETGKTKINIILSKKWKKRKKIPSKLSVLVYFSATIQHHHELLVHLQVAKFHLVHHMCHKPT